MLAEKQIQIPAESLPTITEGKLEGLLKDGRGVLVICHERSKAMEMAQLGCDVQLGTVRDPRGFNTVLCAPVLQSLQDRWQHIVLADGDCLPGQAAMIRTQCPNAALYAMKPNPRLQAILSGWEQDRGQLGIIYKSTAPGKLLLPEPMQQETGMDRSALTAGLIALRWSGLIEFTPEPWRVARVTLPQGTKLPDSKSPVNSPIMRYLRQAAGL